MPTYKVRNKETNKIFSLYGDTVEDAKEFLKERGLENLYEIIYGQVQVK